VDVDVDVDVDVELEVDVEVDVDGELDVDVEVDVEVDGWVVNVVVVGWMVVVVVVAGGSIEVGMTVVELLNADVLVEAPSFVEVFGRDVEVSGGVYPKAELELYLVPGELLE
jgi:hypothetical protein